MGFGASANRRARRAVALALLAFCAAVAEAGCGRKETPKGVLPAGQETQAVAVPSAGNGNLPAPVVDGFAAFVIPSTPSRIAPPSISVKSPPGQGAKVVEVKWFVNGLELENGLGLPPSRFQRGDRVHAIVKLLAGGSEKIIRTPEVVTGNALPMISDARIEPAAPITGSTVRAVVQAQDADGDILNIKYRWYVNDLPVGGDSESLVLAGVKKGSWVHVTATPNDGVADGAWKDSPRYQVVNAPPVVKSPSPTSVPPSLLFRHTLVAEDADGDPLTYVLTKSPPGMTLTGSILEWQVPEEYIGKPVEAVVTISDGDGGQTVQIFSMTVRRNSSK